MNTFLAEEVCRHFDTSLDGLTEEQVEENLNTYGYNGMHHYTNAISLLNKNNF